MKLASVTSTKIRDNSTGYTIALKVKTQNMSRKEPDFAERQQTAAKAKQAQIERIRAMVLANDAQSAERQAARVETAKALQIRTAERKYANRVIAERKAAELVAEKARRASAVAEESARKGAEGLAQAEADAALKNDQKVARDSKYAARKARQK